MTTIAAWGLFTAIPQIDGHPVRYAFAISWILSVVISALMRDKLLQMDPTRFRLVRWEREGRIYRWLGAEASESVRWAGV